MNRRLLTLSAVLACAPIGGFAHRLDEYLQATMITLSKDRLQAEIRLTPGVAVLPAVLADADPNADGVISPVEQRAYAGRVLGDLSLRMDGAGLAPRLVSMEFPPPEDMRAGRGEIRLEIEADLPRNGPDRKILFENRHQPRIAAYQVNCLVPRDAGIHVIAQNRNYTQSVYELTYVQAATRPGPLTFVWLGGAGLLLVGRLAMAWRHRLHGPHPPKFSEEEAT